MLSWINTPHPGDIRTFAPRFKLYSKPHNIKITCQENCAINRSQLGDISGRPLQ